MVACRQTTDGMYDTQPKSSRDEVAGYGASQLVTADDQRAAPASTGEADRARFEDLASGYLADLQGALSNLDLDAILRIVERLRAAIVTLHRANT